MNQQEQMARYIHGLSEASSAVRDYISGIEKAQKQFNEATDANLKRFKESFAKATAPTTAEAGK